MVDVSGSQTVTSAHFAGRARHYRFAAALTYRRREKETFRNLAMMFEKIAIDFERLELSNSKRRVRRENYGLPENLTS